MVMPVIRDIPSAKLPPQKVRDIKAGEFDRRYPLHGESIKPNSRPGPVLRDIPPKKSPAQNHTGEPGKNRITDERPQVKTGNPPARDVKVIKDSRGNGIRVPPAPAAGRDNHRFLRKKETKPVILTPTADKSPSGIAPPRKEPAPPIVVQQRNDRGPTKQNLPSDTSVRPHAQPAQPKAVQPVVIPPNPQGPGVGQPKRETKPVVQPRSILTGPAEARPAVKNTPSVPLQPAPPAIQQRNDRGPGKENPPSGKSNETRPVIKGSHPVPSSPAANLNQQRDGGNRRVLEPRPVNKHKDPDTAQSRLPGNVTPGRN